MASTTEFSVVCVNVGDYCGRGLDYVMNLREQIHANLRRKFRFYCVTDEAANQYRGTRCKPYDPRLPGWWQKIRLFKPGMFPEGRVLYLDLDTILVDDISFLADYQGDFATLHDFWRPKGLGPAVMLWKSGYGASIWSDFADQGFPMTDPRGDQWWLEEHFKTRPDILQELYPGKFFSYKTSCMQAVPEGAAVVCFHGKPRPHECGGWVKEAWHGDIRG